MGMAACFASASAETLNHLKLHPEEMEAFVYPDDGDSEPPNYADVDKAWHCIHFMLTGTAEVGPAPLSSAIYGGVELGEDVGYGPARIMEPEEVKHVALALAVIGDASFSSRFNPQAMKSADIYLADMCVRDGTDALDYILQNFHSLVDFYRGAADRGDGAILWVC